MLIPWRVGLWTRELKIFENGLKKKHHLAVVLALYHTVSIVSSDSSKDISTGGFNSLRCSTKPSVHSPVLMLEKPYNSSELASDKAIPIQLHGNVKSMYQNKMTIPCKQTWGQLIRRSDTHTLKKNKSKSPRISSKWYCPQQQGLHISPCGASFVSPQNVKSWHNHSTNFVLGAAKNAVKERLSQL